MSEPRIVRLSKNQWINLNHLIAVLPVNRRVPIDNAPGRLHEWRKQLMVILFDGADRTCIHIDEDSEEAKRLEDALHAYHVLPVSRA